MKNQSQAGGLWCSEVLALLDAFAANELPRTERETVLGHLAACSRCAEFGEAYARMVAALRRELADAPELPAETSERLAAALRREL